MQTYKKYPCVKNGSKYKRNKMVPERSIMKKYNMNFLVLFTTKTFWSLTKGLLSFNSNMLPDNMPSFPSVYNKIVARLENIKTVTLYSIQILRSTKLGPVTVPK